MIWQVLSGVLALALALLVGVLLGSRRRSGSPRPDKNLEVEVRDTSTSQDPPPIRTDPEVEEVLDAHLPETNRDEPLPDDIGAALDKWASSRDS